MHSTMHKFIWCIFSHYVQLYYKITKLWIFQHFSILIIAILFHSILAMKIVNILPVLLKLLFILKKKNT